MSIKLFCLENGKTPAVHHAFEVEIGTDESISALKKTIKAENAVDFAHVDAKNLRLWKVNIPVDRDDLIRNQTLQDDNQLPVTDDIGYHWTAPPKRHIHVIIKLPLLSLEEALSYVTPSVGYSQFFITSRTTTNVGGTPPTEVRLWDDFFDDVNRFRFDQQPEFEKPQFHEYREIVNEEDVRGAFNSNICAVLNKLIGPDYNFSRLPTPFPGVPDFNCHYAVVVLILAIEIKRKAVLTGIGETTLADFYYTDEKAMMVIQQIWNYMDENELQYGILSTYDDHWFLYRPKNAQTELRISKTLSSDSESPTVLKAYAYIALRARDDPNSPSANIIPQGNNTRVLRSATKKNSSNNNSSNNNSNSKQPSSSNTSTNHPNQQNFNSANFKFKGLLGQGRSGKTLLCEFRGKEIALKTADLYKTPPDILKEMQKEVQIYKEDLKDIQGKYIPRLVCDGYYGGGWCYIIGTTFVGKHLSDDNKMPKKQTPRALKALNQIHKRGVLHNDIREENILLDSVGRVYLIDFGMARVKLDTAKKFDEEKLKFSLLLERYTV